MWDYAAHCSARRVINAEVRFISPSRSGAEVESSEGMKRSTALVFLIALPACAPDHDNAESSAGAVGPPAELNTQIVGELRAVYADQLAGGGQLELALDELHPDQASFGQAIAADRFTLAGDRLLERLGQLGAVDGSKLRIRGKLRGSTITVAPLDSSGADPGIEVVSAPAAALSGAQKTLVIIANYTDATVSCSKNAIEQTVFSGADSINAYYQETSSSALSLTGDVVGPYTLSVDSSGCSYNGWSSEAESLAAADGVDVSAYPRRVYIFPKGGCGSVAGRGTLGGSPSRAWIFGYCYIPDVTAHELGHNFTMHHAATSSSEYGDRSCVMGIGNVGLRQLNAPHQLQMGWVPNVRAMTVSAAGSYSIAPIEADGTDLQLLRIPGATASDDVYVSFRAPIGFDSTELPSTYRYRTSIHNWSGGSSRTHLRALLDDGQEYGVSDLGLTIRQVSNSINGAQVELTAGCSEGTPELTASPTSRSSSGDPVSYQLAVKNNDTLGCAASDFTLSATVPTGLNGTIASPTLTVGGGNIGSTSLTVAIDGATGGTHQIGVELARGGSVVGSRSVTLILDVSAPATPTGLVASSSRKQISLGWDASSDDTAVVGYHVYRDGALIATTSSPGYADRSVQSKVVYRYQVAAFDAADNTSPKSAEVAAQLSSNNGKSGGGGGGSGGNNGKKPN